MGTHSIPRGPFRGVHKVFGTNGLINIMIRSEKEKEKAITKRVINKRINARLAKTKTTKGGSQDWPRRTRAHTCRAHSAVGATGR